MLICRQIALLATQDADLETGQPSRLAQAGRRRDAGPGVEDSSDAGGRLGARGDVVDEGVAGSLAAAAEAASGGRLLLVPEQVVVEEERARAEAGRLRAEAVALDAVEADVGQAARVVVRVG